MNHNNNRNYFEPSNLVSVYVSFVRLMIKVRTKNISRREAIDMYIVYNDYRTLDYTSVRVKLNSLGLGVGISPLVALVSVELHS